jgi:hypothetical protein
MLSDERTLIGLSIQFEARFGREMPKFTTEEQYTSNRKLYLNFPVFETENHAFAISMKDSAFLSVVNEFLMENRLPY